jgi:Zn-dependent proteases
MHETMWTILLWFINARARIGRLFGFLFTINYSLIAVPIAIAVYCWPDFRLFCALMSFCIGIGASLLFHEMCHAWAGHYFGHRVREIGLLPIGGYTLFRKRSGTRWDDLFISLAGPLGNGMICVGLVALEIGLLDGDITARLCQTIELLYGDDAAIEGLPFLVVWANAVLRINVILLIFNLLPAFPLDGGRALRIILSHVWTERQAGVITMWVSRTIASGVAVYTLVDAIIGTGSPIDILIALPISFLIWCMSGMEVTRTRCLD